MGALTAKWRRAHSSLLFSLALVLMLPLALSDAFPFFARAIAGADAHVCQCKVVDGHSECACPICHPDRADFALSEESIRGKCGADSVLYGGHLGIAVAPSALTSIVAVHSAAEPVIERATDPPQLFHSPPVPPPRNASI